MKAAHRPPVRRDAVFNLLVAAQGEPVSKEQLARVVYGQANHFTLQCITSTIFRLRRKRPDVEVITHGGGGAGPASYSLRAL